MSVEKVTQWQSTIEDGLEGLRFVFPSQRNIFVMIFLPVWMVGWFFGEISAIKSLRNGEEFSLFLMTWLTFWTFGGISAAFNLLWMLAGKEIVRINSGVLVHGREILGFGFSKKYDLAQISNLRVSPIPASHGDRKSKNSQFGLFGGVVAFDYGAKTVRFGGSIEEAEGKMVVDRISRRHGFPGMVD